jgi:hypothetical protein
MKRLDTVDSAGRPDRHPGPAILDWIEISILGAHAPDGTPKMVSILESPLNIKAFSAAARLFKRDH